MGHDHEHEGCGCGCGCGTTQAARPEDLGIDWKSAPESEMVCPCQGVSKKRIVEAIEMGGYTLALVKAMTGAGRGSDCNSINPRGRSCEIDIEELIRIYSQNRPSFSGIGCG